MKARLGVNIDHAATLRQARGTLYPDMDLVAKKAIEAGADQITIHLREDRRHIQDDDVFSIKKICEHLNCPLNLEIGASSDVLRLALKAKPDWLCLVPENRQELTTEGGLDLKSQFDKINEVCQQFAVEAKQTKISLFIESSSEMIALAKKLPIQAVEIHTGEYAHDFNADKNLSGHLKSYQQSYESLLGSGIALHAGHGLTAASCAKLVEMNIFEEYNIGHWIIAESLIEGIGPVVSKLKSLICGE